MSALPPAPQPSPTADQSRWFSEEVAPHGSQLKAYLHNAYPTVGDVDDVVQESYLRIWKAQTLQPIQSAKAFLFQIARRLALDFLREEKASRIDRQCDLSTLSVVDHAESIVETINRNEKIQLLAGAIDTLPKRCREIFILRRLQCIPQKEVADLLGLSERTVESQVFQGLKRCQTYLRARGVRGLFGDEKL